MRRSEKKTRVVIQTLNTVRDYIHQYGRMPGLEDVKEWADFYTEAVHEAVKTFEQAQEKLEPEDAESREDADTEIAYGRRKRRKQLDTTKPIKPEEIN